MSTSFWRFLLSGQDPPLGEDPFAYLLTVECAPTVRDAERARDRGSAALFFYGSLKDQAVRPMRQVAARIAVLFKFPFGVGEQEGFGHAHRGVGEPFIKSLDPCALAPPVNSVGQGNAYLAKGDPSLFRHRRFLSYQLDLHFLFLPEKYMGRKGEI